MRECLTRAFTAQTHAQNGRTYGKFHQSMLRRDSVCMQSCQSLHCSRTYTKWVYIWHLLSVNAQTNLSMRECLTRAFTAQTHAQNGCIYGIFYQSMLKQTLAYMQSHQSIHCSNTCTKWAYIQHIPSVNAQTRLSMRTASPEPSPRTCTNWAYILHILSVIP